MRADPGLALLVPLMSKLCVREEEDDGKDMISRGLEAKPLSGGLLGYQPATYRLPVSLKGSEKQRSAPENTPFSAVDTQLFHPLINKTSDNPS